MPVNHLWVGGIGGWRCPFCRCCVWWLWVLAAVGWWIWWLSCLFGGESCDGFLVFGHCGYWCAPGWDEADPGVEPVHVAASGRPLRVIIVNTVVVGAQEGQVLDVGVAACLPGDEVMDLAVISGLITAWSCTRVEFSVQGEALFEVCSTL